MGLLSGARKVLFVMEHMITEGHDAANAVFKQNGGKRKTSKKAKKLINKYKRKNKKKIRTKKKRNKRK